MRIVRSLPGGVILTLAIFDPEIPALEKKRDGMVAVIVVAALALGGE